MAVTETLESTNNRAARGRRAVPGLTRVSTVLCTSGTGRLRPGVPDRLRRLGASVAIAPTLGEAMKSLDEQPADMCVVDLTTHGAPPTAVRLLRTRHPRIPVVGLVDPADSLMAAEAIQSGLVDVLPWPCEDRDLALALANAVDRAAWGDARPAGDEDGHDPVFAQSAAMREVLDLAESIAANRGSVLLCGEPGTGRRLIARTIHRWSTGDARKGFVEFDCRGDDAQSVEQRLFGVPLGRGTGAQPDMPAVQVGKPGAVVAARGGTLFFTRVVDLSARVQSALARLLRDREANLEGNLIDLDIRAVAALEPDVETAVSDGRLQVDLFERLSQWRIDLPPLRRRQEDVPALAAWLLQATSRGGNAAPKAFSRSALALLSALPWDGNVVELRSMVDRLADAVKRPVVQIDDLLEHASLDGFPARIEAGVSLRDAKARFERDCISAVLRRHHGRVGEAAKALGIQRTNLYRKVRQLKVPRSLLSARK